MNLNARALSLVEPLIERLDERRIGVQSIPGGGRFVDCGINAPGGIAAGLDLARICLANLADVALVPGDLAGHPAPHIQVATDHPSLACLGSQYAGWGIKAGKFFAMGSGPMRTARFEREAILDDIALPRAVTDRVVGVIETRRVPDASVLAQVAEACGVEPDSVTLLGAPTASLAGGAQVVARSVETALHKLHLLHFDLSRITSAVGVAPLPPVAADDLAAIGRTNDAILYGARVTLYVTGADDGLFELVAQIPSVASRDHGEPFAAIFRRYNHDFYQVDPHLFSPAEVVMQNVTTGSTFSAGRLAPDVLARSFFGA